MTLNVFRFTGLNSSLALKAPVRCATTANITLAGLQTIDGVLLQSTDSNLRILVKNQTDSRQNGIYDSQTGNWSRSADWDSNDDFVQATEVRVAQGATQLGWWTLTTSDPITLGTSNITFASIGATLFPDGLAASPGINFAAENTTGFYRPANGQIGISLSGVASALFTQTGLQLGGPDAASPVAQTLQVQSVVAGTSNTAGVNWTLIGSLSTGSGTSGDIIFKTGGTGAGATSQNSATIALTIKGATQVVNVASAGSAAAPSLSIGNATTGIYTVSTTGLAFSINGVSQLDYGITNGAGYWTFQGSQIVGSTGLIGWTSRSTLKSPADSTIEISNGANSQNFYITAPSTATVQLGQIDAASPVAQTLQVQNVVAGTSNTSGVNWTFIGSLSTGSGTSGDLIFRTGGTGAGAAVQNTAATALTIKGATQIVIVGSAGSAGAPSLAVGNATTGLYSVSTTGFAITVNGSSKLDYGITNGGGWTVSGNLIVSSTGLVAWNGRSTLQSPADSVLELSNSANSQNFFVCAPSTATLQLGSTDAASPVAQMLQVQSVVAGNGNTAGVNWTLKGSLSNGSGLSGDIIFQTGDTGAGSGAQNAQNTALTLKGGAASGKSGSVVVGSAAIAANATDGFLYIPTCAGTPTGTPTAFTGRVALVWDTSAHKFWVYDTAWKGGTAPGVWS